MPPRSRAAAPEGVLAEGTDDHPHRGTGPVCIGVFDHREDVAPVHRECRGGPLIGRRQIQPDLKQLEGVGFVTVQQREHLRVDDAIACRHPLHIAVTKSGGCSERVGMVDQPMSDVGDRLEAPVRMLGKPGTAEP